MDKQKILIVDDEPLVISELVGFLRDESYDVFTAENGFKGMVITYSNTNDLNKENTFFMNFSG